MVIFEFNDNNMKASGYNIVIEDTKINETIIYNSLYGSMATFDNVEFGTAKIILENPNVNNPEYLDIFNNLVSQKYIIEEEVDELSIIENRKKLGIKDKN